MTEGTGSMLTLSGDSLQLLQRLGQPSTARYLCRMNETMPFYIEELACSLAEHTTDDDFIATVCLRLYEDDHMVARLLSFLEKRERNVDQIIAFLERSQCLPIL